VYGSASNTQILSGGQEYVAGGVESGAIVSGGLIIGTGGLAQGVHFGGGYIEIYDGGVESGTVAQGALGAGGSAYDFVYGSSVDETLGSGFVQLDYGSATRTIVSSGGTVEVLGGGAASGARILSGGAYFVMSGGVDSGATISAGGHEYVYPGGVAKGATIVSGGAQIVSSGGIASASVVSYGGQVDALIGGTDRGIVVSSGGAEYVLSGGATSASQIGSGGFLYVSASGSGQGAIVGSGGIAYVLSGASVSGFVASGGNISLGSGSTPGGTAIATSALAGGVVTILSGGVGSGSLVGSGGLIFVSSGGLAAASVVSSGGVIEVLSSGATSGTTIVSGGIEYVLSGGVASGSMANGGVIMVGGTSASGGVATGAHVYAGGFIEILSGGVASATSISNGGQEIVYSGGTTINTTVLSGGSLEIMSGATENGTTVVEQGGRLAGGVFTLVEQSVSGVGLNSPFEVIGMGSTLDVVGSPSNLSSFVISGFGDGDSIDLTSLSYADGGSANLLGNNELEISVGGHTSDFWLDQSHSFQNEYFHLMADSGGGTTITENTACYRRGTQILTDRGEISVEALSIGQHVMTISGEPRPIKWIGRRSYSGRFLLGNEHILPICFKSGCLDDNIPRRDLWISPHHAMYLEGVLIEAKDLVNGVSIEQPHDTDDVEYFHIELETHDVIIAEGSLSETFIDDDSRGMFHNAREYPLLYPGDQQAPARYYAPRCDGGYEVEAARERIALRAGLRPISRRNEQLAFRGHVDFVGPDLIEGWAQNEEHPEAPVCLDIYVRDRVIGQTLANQYREDLERAGLGSGHHSFRFVLPKGADISSDVIQIRRSFDGVTIASSKPAKNDARAA
jgi:O-antigen biosynthesis protein